MKEILTMVPIQVMETIWLMSGHRFWGKILRSFQLPCNTALTQSFYKGIDCSYYLYNLGLKWVDNAIDNPVIGFGDKVKIVFEHELKWLRWWLSPGLAPIRSAASQDVQIISWLWFPLCQLSEGRCAPRCSLGVVIYHVCFSFISGSCLHWMTVIQVVMEEDHVQCKAAL